ncbi:TetR/AcrR family transcriptional regulator [Pseudonocardia sp. CA-107938]|uniref:TetR/AcrR family transcriptional regulator n=1 Tax=Pseudonocardia sp. CA-107938 TaxID=3240021 RepID=UPI003D93AB6B
MSRRRLSPQQRRAELVDAAQQVFAAKPYDQVRLEEVAAVAGASTALVSFHFGGKRELYLACLRSVVDELLARHAALPGPPSIERLAAGLRMHLEFATQRRAGYLAIVRGGHETTFPEVTALLADVREQLVARLAEGLGRPRTPALDLALRSYLGYVDTVTASWLELDAAERAQVPVDTVVAVVIGAFRGSIAALPSQ